MKNRKADLTQALQEATSIVGDTFVVDEQALELSGLGIKSTSITIFQALGGFIASLAFLGLMFTINIYKHPAVVLIIGIPLVLLSILQGKLQKVHIPDTVGVFFFIAGCFLTIYGVSLYNIDSNILIGLVMLISTATLSLSENKIVVFSSVLLFFGSLIAFMLENDWVNGIHVVSNLSLAMALFLYHKESETLFARNRLSQLMPSMAYASAIASLITFQIIALPSMLKIHPHFLWLSSLAPLSVSLFLIYQNTMGNRLVVIIAFVLLAAPSIFAPAIIGSMAILLLGFGYRNNGLMIIGILSCIQTTIQFYYDLKFTLLEKSIMMMAIGALLMVAYWAFVKHIRANENR
ncbi:MAG: hypothetical protein RL491_1276 [Bacteroidota bacterium]